MEFSQSKEKHHQNYFFYTFILQGVDYSMNKDIIGNLTTIIKILIMTVAPAIAVYLGTSDETVIAFLTACLTFALAIIDARYPNTLGVFDNKPEDTVEEEVLNPEYTAPYDLEADDGD